MSVTTDTSGRSRNGCPWERGERGGPGHPWYGRCPGNGPFRGFITSAHCGICHSDRHNACTGCGNCMARTRSDRAYCSNACRQRAYRRRSLTQRMSQSQSHPTGDEMRRDKEPLGSVVSPSQGSSQAVETTKPLRHSEERASCLSVSSETTRKLRRTPIYTPSKWVLASTPLCGSQKTRRSPTDGAENVWSSSQEVAT